MARRLCLSVFLPPKLFCLPEDLQHEANQGAVPVVSWPSSELGCLTGSCRDEASFLACLRLFHFWTRYPGTAEAFFGAVLLALWFCASASTLLQEGPGSPVHVEQSALDTTPFSKGRVDCRRLRQRQCDRTPPLSLRTFCAAPLLSCQRLGTSRTQERMDAAIWPSARKYPPNAECLLLLWGALEGLGRLSSLEGEACPQAAGPDLFSRKGAGWDTVDSGSEEQAYVFSPATLSTLVRLHDTSGYSR